MSAATAPPPPAPAPQPGRAPSAPPATAVVPTPAAAPATRSVPSTLALLRVVAAVTVLAWGALTALQLVLTWQSTNAAAADSAQLVRLQEAKVELLRADALATNAFLVGGLESSEQRTAYDDAMASASADISAALQAQPADAAVLTELNTLVLHYGATMELARANNLQGYPVGAAYLNEAGTDLRGRGLALLDAAIDANDSRARSSMSILGEIGIIAVTSIAALAVLWFLNRWIATRFKRRYNLGLVWAAVGVLAVGVASLAATSLQSSEYSLLINGDYAQTTIGSDVRSSGNLARSAEALRLIARGSGAAQEEIWKQQADHITSEAANGAGALLPDWETYATKHAEIVALDEGGDWDGAVAAATAAGEGTATGAFTAFDDNAGSYVGLKADALDGTLTSGAWLLLLLAAAAVIVALVTAGTAWRGVSQRLEEYA